MPVSSPDNDSLDPPESVDLGLEVSRELNKREAEAWLAQRGWQLMGATADERAAIWNLRAFLLAARTEVFQPARFEDRKGKLDQWLFSLGQAFLGRAHSDAAAAVAETAERYEIPRAFFYDALTAIESNLMLERLVQPNDLLRLAYRQNASFTLSVAKVVDLYQPAHRDYFLCLGIGTGLMDILVDWSHWERTGWLPIPQAWWPGTWGARGLFPRDYRQPLRLTASVRRRYLPSIWRQMATLGIETLAQAKPPTAVAASAMAPMFAQWQAASMDRLHAVFDDPQQLL
jgi:phytoene/squalene synthetase